MKQGVFLTVLCCCFFLGLCFSSGMAGDEFSGSVTGKLMGMDNPERMRQYAQQVASWHEKREAAMHDALQEHFLHEHFLQMIDKEITSGHKMLAFRKEAMNLREGKTPFSRFRTERRDGWREQVNGQWGDISGYVTVDGNPADVTVVAFDEQGYYVNEGYSSIYYDGYYQITLPVGAYYILTFSEGHIDEFYDNIPALSGSMENWRQASLVEVIDGVTTEHIDFDLQPGVTMRGLIQDDSGNPIDDEFGFFFRIYRADRLEYVSLLPQYELIADDEYALTIPATGTVKVFAGALGYRGEWFANKTTWEEADPIALPSPGDTIRGIDFGLEQLTIGGDGSISGVILTGDGADTLDYAFVVAFDLADTSIAGFSLSTDGSYTISGLRDGDYIVYCDDIPLATLGQDNRIGEYYLNAATPSQATTVVISGQSQVGGIDFTLDTGGAIGGTVTGPGGAPMDSILVLAFHADILVWDPFLSNIQFGFTLTDGDGNFQINGLPSGAYVLRTVTLPPLYLDLGFGEISIPGTYYGKVVDEYYDGVQSILDFNEADRVAVTAPEVTTGIDFTLEAAGMITGVVKAADDTTYTPGGFLIAFDAGSRLPRAIGVVDWDRYYLGPLPEGEYVVFDLALVLGLVKTPSDRDNIHGPYQTEPVYLSEFYDDARYFEEATPVAVVPGDTATGIDFFIDLGGRLQGTIFLDTGYPAGADTLWGFPVIAYDAASGNMAAMSWATFSGGYMFNTLPTGGYKVCALPCFHEYAATYYGGGSTFDDPLSDVIRVTSAETFDADITLFRGGGSISGYVHDEDTGGPVTGSMVIAYDPTGHVAGMGFAGYDWFFQSALDNNGAYEIPGLGSGQYSVRTWSLMGIMVYIRDLLTGAAGEFIDIGSILSPESEFDFAADMYEDEWYGDVSIGALEYDMVEMINELMGLGVSLGSGMSDLPLMMPTTYIDQSHGTQVNVTAPQETPNINFNLKSMDILGNITGVENDSESRTHLPEAFGLSQNSPNPFNPTTTIQYSVVSDQTTHYPLLITLKIFNLLGQEVRTLVDEVQEAGYYTVTWDGRDESGREVGSGVYFCRLTAGDFSDTRRMVLIK